MGFDAYLFDVKFRKPIPQADIVDVFDAVGMAHLAERQAGKTDKSYSEYYFELRTKNGLTEAHCVLSPTDSALNYFNMRFSIGSPKTVVGQTFALLQKLYESHPVDVHDTEIRNHFFRNGISVPENTKVDGQYLIPIDESVFIRNELGILKREIACRNDE
jgi:hypothetical protein